jgi:hypothetical protein
MTQLPISMPSLPTYRESVDKVASAENLQAVASATSDPEILLGLSFLAKAGDPVRRELAEMATRTRNEYTPIVAVLSLIMDRIDEESVGELVQSDPDNALGHYLQGTLFHVSNRESEALSAFRKAAACSELRLYDATIGEALFKALEALDLKGLNRLCALSWTVSRWTNFSSAGIQPIYWALSELARPADRTTRSALAETLMTLAGHLFATNFTNRWFARQAVQSAFGLKAELAAAEEAPKMNAYAAAIQGLNNAMLPGTDLEDPMKPSVLQLAQFLPSRIHSAFAATDPSRVSACFFGERNLNLPETERAAFEAAKEHATQAAKKLIDVALSDPDGILGAYLKGLPRSSGESQKPPWASFCTPVGSLMEKRPDLFRAAAENEEAMSAIWRAGQNDPAQQNMGRMMEIGWAIQTYAHNHDRAYPDNLAILFETGQLKSPLEAKSLLTGRPYVYVAAGEKNPAKSNDQAMFVLLYDDELNQYGCYPCVFACCVGSHIRVHDLNEQLERRGK